MSKEADKFVYKIQELYQHYKEICLLVRNKKTEKSLKNELVVQFIFRITVLWESFLSDLILAYIQKDTKTFEKKLRDRISNSIESKFGKTVYDYIEFAFPNDIKKNKLSNMLDKKGWNFTVKSSDELASKASDVLSSRYAKKFSLDKKDSEFFDFVLSLRNYLGHLSKYSRNVLKKNIDNFEHPDNKYFSCKLNQIGPYLKQEVSPPITRVDLIVERIIELAKKL